MPPSPSPDETRIFLANACAEVKSPHLLPVRADATSAEDWKKLVAAVVEKFGRIDVLVSNHGAGVKVVPLEEMSDENIRRILSTNIESVIIGCREVLPAMRKRGVRHIINVASACSRHSWPNWSTYSAAKAGLLAFTAMFASGNGQKVISSIKAIEN